MSNNDRVFFLQGNFGSYFLAALQDAALAGIDGYASLDQISGVKVDQGKDELTLITGVQGEYVDAVTIDANLGFKHSTDCNAKNYAKSPFSEDHHI